MNIFSTAGSYIVAGVHSFLQICGFIFQSMTGLFSGQPALSLERIGLWITPQQAVTLLRGLLRILTR